jgi:RHS repeat-associated protein
MDSETGLMYYRARWYEPKQGRFLSEDPIGFEGGDINLAIYVHNNPISWIDPHGEQSRSDAKWQPGEVEQMRRLAEHVRSMPTPRNDCGCQSKPQSPLLFAAGIAIADGPQPGITDVLAVGLLLTYAFGTSQTADCTPPKVIPFPKPEPRPTPLFPPLPNKPGEICRLKAKDGAFCIYICKDGTEFKTLTDTGSKHGTCPPAAPRP